MKALLLPALALGIAACAAEPERPVVSVRALYLEPLYGGEAARVEHEAIEDWMPAMEMALSVTDPALLDGLEPGDPVTLRLDSLSLRIVGVEPLPPGTVLDLPPDEEPEGIVVPGE